MLKFFICKRILNILYTDFNLELKNTVLFVFFHFVWRGIGGRGMRNPGLLLNLKVVSVMGRGHKGKIDGNFS